MVNLFVLLGFAALCTIISGWAKAQHRKVADWLVGFLFGVMSVIVMLVPVRTPSGLLVDCRIGVVGAASLLGGPVTALTCLPLPCVYRLQLGGPGVAPCVFEMVCACLLGALGHVLIKRERRVLTLRLMLLLCLGVGLGAFALNTAYFGFGELQTRVSDMGLAGIVAVALSGPVSMALLATMILLEQRHFWTVDSFDENERLMLHSQKMAAVGQISHKIAHSMLNALTVIMGQAEQAREEAGNPAAVERNMRDIMTSVNGLADLAGELVTFSVPSLVRFRKMDLSRCLVGVERLLSKVVGQEVEVVIDGRRDAGLVNVDPNRIEQVILQMAITASDAMGGKGRLTISASPAVLDKADRERLQAKVRGLDRHRGDFALLSVLDTGEGSADTASSRMFGPFFTARDSNDKVGRRLASVYAIVRHHRGIVDIQTLPGGGTAFRVYLPVVS